jgi:hypothetical protein
MPGVPSVIALTCQVIGRAVDGVGPNCQPRNSALKWKSAPLATEPIC